MPIDPASILHVLPKPNGRNAVLLRRILSRGAARLEITLAHALPDGAFHAIRSIGIGPDLLKAFAEAAPAAVGAVLAGGASSPPGITRGPSTGLQTRDMLR